ncbi:hypothetical protein B4064_3316 [Caldibacillus thermoamylovorans]|nr:hypothetical protein B4064_3316 [Caldibacillus thermoamylovorans]
MKEINILFPFLLFPVIPKLGISLNYNLCLESVSVKKYFPPGLLSFY